MTHQIKNAGTLSRRSFITASIAMLTAGISAPALAHRERTTLTEIEWEDNPGFLYITHGFHVHEAERTLFAAGVLSKPDLYSLKSRAELALYAADHFAMTHPDGTAIELELLGAEIMGSNCLVYQQADLGTLPDGFDIDCRFMRSLNAEQINNVDVKVTETVQSITFRGDDRVKSIVI